MAVTRSIVRDICVPMVRGIADKGAGGFSPASLFAAGEQGAWYDPSDFSSMFQDSAGTTPVTGVGQPVGLIRDKSGNNNHASQATATARPLLQVDGNGKYYLAFDGVNDYIQGTGFSLSSNMTIMGGMQRTANTVVFIKAYNSPNSSTSTAQAGAGTSYSNNAGAAVTYVNGVVVTPATRGAVATAWPINTTKIVESQQTDMSLWGGLCFGYYHSFGGLSRLYETVACDSMTPTQIAQTRTYVGAACGVTI